MYFDQNLSLPPKYIGQSFGRSPRTLAKRIRWEVVKDGTDGGAVSRFSQKCQEHAVNKPSLILKVGNIKEPSDPSKHDPQLMNDIEMALIHEMQQSLSNHERLERNIDFPQGSGVSSRLDKEENRIGNQMIAHSGELGARSTERRLV